MLATANARKTQRGFGKMQVNGPGGLKISKEEISGSKRSMHGYSDLLQALRGAGEPLRSGFSTDGPLISASVVPRYGYMSGREKSL